MGGNAPLIIPANIPESMRRALDIVNAGRFPVHELARGALLSADRLHVPSMQSYVVDGRAIPFPRIGALSARHLRFVRERILRFVNESEPSRRFPQKVYLSRGRRARTATNENEIQGALESKGFFMIDPVALDFVDQVRLFRDAEVIVGATGAASHQPTILRTRSGVFALVAVKQNIDFTLFTNVLQVAGGGRYNQVPGNFDRFASSRPIRRTLYPFKLHGEH